MNSGYINTDIGLDSNENLEELSEFLSKGSCLLFGGLINEHDWHITIEAEGSGIEGSDDHNIESDFEKLIPLLAQAKEKYPKEFESLTTFEFNIGWNAPKEHPPCTPAISNKLISEVVSLGASIAFTIYPAPSETVEAQPIELSNG